MARKAFLLLVFTLFLVSCVSHMPKAETPIQHKSEPLSSTEVIEMSRDATIAFLSRTLKEEEYFYEQCTGFWVDTDVIMTALHCPQGAAHIEKVRKYPPKERDKAQKSIPKVQNPTGFVMTYIVESESTGIVSPPSKTHKAQVIAIDEKHDLALLKADMQDLPRHGWLHIAKQSPKIGDKVYITGHPGDFCFTTINGMVSALRPTYPFDPNDDFNVDGPLIQVFSGIYKGNSGGAVVSEKGEAIGVVSFIARVPNQGFAVAPSIMEKLIADTRAKNLL